jgi:hypothetical protein
MPNRFKFAGGDTTKYRFGHNGQQKDNEGESKWDRMFRHMAGAHRGEMLDFGGGGYNMFGGYGRGTLAAKGVDKVKYIGR